jgi:hypothetical protein
MSVEARPEHSDGTAAPPFIGIDPLYSDCVIKARSGKSYYTSKGALATCSSVFRDLVECCGQGPSLGNLTRPNSSNSETEGVNAKKHLEIPLEDREEEVAMLVEHVHQPERFLLSVCPVLTQKGAARILLLTPMAFKYNMQGNHRAQLLLVSLVVWPYSIFSGPGAEKCLQQDLLHNGIDLSL